MSSYGIVMNILVGNTESVTMHAYMELGGYDFMGLTQGKNPAPYWPHHEYIYL
jgi:hypothetical protein